MSVQELKEVISKKKDLIILDVREKDEYELGTIQGARHKPLGSLLRDLGMFRYDLMGKEVVCFCKSGVRSSIAADFLERAGIKTKSLTNGFMAWEQEKNL
ncbi:rhodanese-like domain-containing protein [Candidatus Woesearchaeota archaeon]|nr:rhodanese-like domain-containing protein [Candidatus Woesearchaeota archaeon]